MKNKMSNEQKETRENRAVPFDLAACVAMMEEMIGQEGCARNKMMFHMMGQGGYPEMMSQAMASCCGLQDETEEKTSADTTQEA
jgi:hypothetical protein